MTYGELIALCESLDGDCIKCGRMADCKSFRKGLENIQPCYISRLWNEEIEKYDFKAYRKFGNSKP